MSDNIRRLVTIFFAATLVCYIIAALHQTFPLWLMICFFPIAALDTIFLLISTRTLFWPWLSASERLRKYGIEAEGVILEATDYGGDGLHNHETCFRGKYEYTDHLGQRHEGNFRGWCYDAFDFVDPNVLQFPLVNYYQAGAKVTVFYSRRNPSRHAFFGPKLTFRKMENTQSPLPAAS